MKSTWGIVFGKKPQSEQLRRCEGVTDLGYFQWKPFTLNLAATLFTDKC